MSDLENPADWRIQYKRPVYLGCQGHVISKEAFEEFTKQYGVGKATVYLQALQDFTCQLEAILDGGFCRPGVTDTAYRVKKEVIALVDHNRDFLVTFQDRVPTRITSSPD